MLNISERRLWIDMFLCEWQEDGRESHTCSSDSVGFPPKDDDTIGSHHDEGGRIELFWGGGIE